MIRSISNQNLGLKKGVGFKRIVSTPSMSDMAKDLALDLGHEIQLVSVMHTSGFNAGVCYAQYNMPKNILASDADISEHIKNLGTCLACPTESVDGDSEEIISKRNLDMFIRRRRIEAEQQRKKNLIM